MTTGRALDSSGGQGPSGCPPTPSPSPHPDPNLPGIYVSIPFCAQKCTYCNFRSNVYARSLREDYIRNMSAEIAQPDGPVADTLYFGGGSPSLLEPEEFEKIAKSLPAREWMEATIEVAPGEAVPDRVDEWIKAGITRASLGVQSFEPRVARQAGRSHTPETVRSDVALLRSRGVREISLDLIAGLSCQSAGSWRRSLEWVERLEVEHVSVYMLETDDDSRLGREIRAGGERYGAPDVPTEDETVDFYLSAVERLRQLGYERYEVSNFARPNSRSRHNLKYWRMAPYFGFGSDAHSFDGNLRWRNVATAPEYVARMEAGRSPREETERLDEARLLEDRILTGLRTADGVRLDAGEWSLLRPAASGLAARGWLEARRPNLRLTDEGMLFADEAVAELLG